MRKRIVSICVCLALLLVLALVYALVILPEPESDVTETTATEELIVGEVAGTNGRVQMFDYIKSADVESLLVHNANGEYRLVRDENDNLVIDGYEGLLIDSEKLTQMIVNAGYTLSTFRSEVTEEDFSKYGLGEGESDAYFVLRSKAGKRYTVYIGDRTLAGTGYYARYEGRDASYVLDDSIEADLLGTVEYLVRPLLAYPSSLNSYYLMRTFMLGRGEDVFLTAGYLDPDTRSELAAMSVHQLSYPGEYAAGEYYNDVLTLFCDFSGSEVVAIDLDDETLAKFGLDTPAYTLYAENTIVDDDGNPESIVGNYITFSEKQQDADGNYFYYAASYLFGIIARVEQITVDFLEWNLDKWVSANIFQVNIVNVASLKFESEGQTVTFVLGGEDNTNLTVVEKETGHTPDVTNFRQLWKALLSITMDGTVDLSDEEITALTAGDDNLLLTMTVKTKAGNERVYRFYPYTDRRVFYTVNGQGEFYTNRTMLNKIISDVGKVMRDETVDSEARF